MSTKAIYEATGKKILNKYLGSTAEECRCVSIDQDTNWEDLLANNRWLETEVLYRQINPCGNEETVFFVLAFGCQT